jgi:lactate permease
VAPLTLEVAEHFVDLARREVGRTYGQVDDPDGGSLWLTAVLAAAPLVVLFVLLGGLRSKGHWAGLIALAVAAFIAVAVWQSPPPRVLAAATRGAAFGLFPIVWILVNALWIFRMTEVTGHFDVVRRSFASVSDDHRVQGVVIAFSFGAMLEALTGFGAPVAVCCALLMALGFEPIKAAAVALLANTAPVPFGAIGTPIVTLSGVTGLPPDQLAAIIGRQTPVLALFVPLILVFVIDGRRGIREVWPLALVVGASFAIGQFLCSNFGPWALTDIVASLISLVAAIVLLRVWLPTNSGRQDPHPPPQPHGNGEHGWAGIALAYAPYAIIVAVFVLAQLDPVKGVLIAPTQRIPWPGLASIDARSDPTGTSTFTFDWLSAGGTMLLMAGLATVAVLRIAPRTALSAYADTVRGMRWTIVTISAVLALAAVMTASGQTLALGSFLATAGAAFAFISPIIGWLGVTVTGSDTASNALFGALQVEAATRVHLSPTLMAAANSSGGVLGKMCSVQHLAIAAAAVGMSGREGDVIRRLLGWSVGLILLMGVLVWLQSTPILAWMVT